MGRMANSRMHKHRRILILLAVASLFALLVILVARDCEPTHDGHSLSYWLQRDQQSVKTNRPHTDQADNSAKAIPTSPRHTCAAVHRPLKLARKSQGAVATKTLRCAGKLSMRSGR